MIPYDTASDNEGRDAEEAEPDRWPQFSGHEPPPVRVRPAEEFDDDYWDPRGNADPRTRGRKSNAVEGRLSGSCCGWNLRPTAAEFHEAVAADEPTERQKEVVGVLIDEGTAEEMARAYFEGAFTWRRLVRIMTARNGGRPHRLARFINLWNAKNLHRSRQALLEIR